MMNRLCQHLLSWLVVVAVTITTLCSGVAPTLAQDSTSTQAYTTIDNEYLLEEPPGVTPQIIPWIIAALEGALSWFGRDVGKKVVVATTASITKAIEKYGKDLRFSGPKRSPDNPDNHTLFTLYYKSDTKSNQLIRVDLKVLKKPGGYYAYIHFHVGSKLGGNIQDHIDIPGLTEYYLSKNMPKFPW